MKLSTKASFAMLALAPHNLVASAPSSSSSAAAAQPLWVHQDGSSGKQKKRGIFSGDGVTFTEEESPVTCVLHLLEPNMIDPDANEMPTIACVLDSKYEGDSISGTTYELDVSSFPYGFFYDVEYSETILTISSASIQRAMVSVDAVGVGGKPNKPASKSHGGGIISMKEGSTASKERRGNGNGNGGGGGLRGRSGEQNGMLFDRSRGRRLAQTMGNSSLIVLYAAPLDASNTHRTPSQLANDIFGINTNEAQDPVNARSQVLRCSRGQLNYIPACGTSGQACYPFLNQSVYFVNGVLRVPINYNIAGVASGTVKNWVEAEAQKILQAQNPPIDLFGFNQIMHVIPDAADWGGAAAWAYLPGQTSAFQSSYSFTMGVQVHEFGHNIGLHHSGYNGASYADHSCLMGNPSYGDDGPEICWNGAKSWETGWYAADSVDVFPSSTVPFTSDLIGVADWSEGTYTPGNHSVVLRVTDSSVTQKYHIMYNRATGPNAGVTFARNQVTVTLGASQQVSWHQAGLGPVMPANNQYPIFRKERFNGGNKWLVVKLCGMTSGPPDIASVMVYLDDGPAFNNGFMCPGELPCTSNSGCDDGNFCTQNTCVNNTCMPPTDISASVCPACGAQTFCNPSGTCDPVCTDNNQCTADSCIADTCQNAPIPGCTIPGALLETWLGIGGTSVSDLTSNVAYQSPPNEVIDILGSLATPVDRADNFGARLRTYLMPPATGTYTFYVASDDSSELWLSIDENPANKVLIARVNGWTGRQVWTTYASQRSSPISLTSGSSYFLEALQKEGGGGDHLSVAWESTNARVPLGVINGSYFYEVPPVPCSSIVDCLSTNPCTSGQCNLVSTMCEYTPIVGCENGAKLETWFGISGGGLSTLKTNQRYISNSPNTTIILTNFLESPTNRADNFGARMQTYLTPPVTCNYTFYIASDDEGELYLSNNTNHINKVKIAWITAWAGPREWKKYATQRSSPMTLEKGKLYFMEALHKEGGGGDNLAIAWECLDQNIALEVIGIKYTSVALPGSTTSPTNSPSKGHTKAPSKQPSSSPSRSPTTAKPTKNPTLLPTHAPTNQPISSQSLAPTTANPTPNPTVPPTHEPSNQPSSNPSLAPTTANPTPSPTVPPTYKPTNQPSSSPSFVPTTARPTALPSFTPSRAPTKSPSSIPSFTPTTVKPTAGPSFTPSRAPTNTSSMKPTGRPTPNPTNLPCSTFTTKSTCSNARCSWNNSQKRCV